jgi:hypothetical protein
LKINCSRPVNDRLRRLTYHKKTAYWVKDQEEVQTIETKRKGMPEEQSLPCNYKKPRFWTEEEEYSQQKPERQEMQAKTPF